MLASLTPAALTQAWQVRRANFAPEIGFDTPSRTLPISLTGAACALDCAHCGGHYLRHMVSVAGLQMADGRWQMASRVTVDSPPAIRNPQSAIRNPTSLLISGGCDAQGRVPVAAHLEAIRALRPGRRLNWHVGLIEADDLAAIRPYVDAISFDFVGDDATIHEVYGLERTVEDYVECYRRLQAAAPVVPHLTIGLRGGALGHEYPALRRLRELGATALVFLVFIPTPGTRYAGRRPPAVEEVADLLAQARLIFPTTPLILGCMRPGGEYRRRLDPLAVRAGMNRLVNPAATAVQTAAALGLKVVRGEECCVF